MLGIEGYAIVTVDGMIADANGVMPASLRHDADQHFLQTSLDGAAVVIHGRHSHEGGPRAADRKRLIATRQIESLAADPANPNTLFWNPRGAPLEAALARLGVENGIVAVIGGTEVFSLFLPRYDAFHLTRADNARLPGGVPVFSEVDENRTPEDVLSQHGLRPGPRRPLDPAAGVFVVSWRR